MEDLVDNLNNLKKEAVPSWGKMNASQMLNHCNLFIDLYLNKIEVPWLMRTISRVLSPIFINYILKKDYTQAPKNLNTYSKIRVDDLSIDFEKEKSRLIEQLRQIDDLQGMVDHPLYGRVNAELVKKLVVHHTSHHFHQFGLM
jgi:hypothetical protein